MFDYDLFSTVVIPLNLLILSVIAEKVVEWRFPDLDKEVIRLVIVPLFIVILFGYLVYISVTVLPRNTVS